MNIERYGNTSAAVDSDRVWTKPEREEPVIQRRCDDHGRFWCRGLTPWANAVVRILNHYVARASSPHVCIGWKPMAPECHKRLTSSVPAKALRASGWARAFTSILLLQRSFLRRLMECVWFFPFGRLLRWTGGAPESDGQPSVSLPFM